MKHAFILVLKRSIQFGVNAFAISIFLIKPLSALTMQTKQIIHGHGPYLSFDGGVTAASNLQDLLKITLPDNRHYDSNHNGQITLPIGQYSLKDITTSAVADNSAQPIWPVIENSHVYYDYDGDVFSRDKVVGTITAIWKNSENTIITDLDSKVSPCFSPYTLTINISDVILASNFGIPSQQNYPAISKSYQISPLDPDVCYARPNLSYGTEGFAGPATEWNPTKGFLVQSKVDYSKNFPTTGADKLFFDLEIKGATEVLNWQSITKNNITVEVSNISINSVRVTLNGPKYSTNGAIASFTPTEFELIAKNTQNREVIKYGFKLTHWFVGGAAAYGGNNSYEQAVQRCLALGNYRMANADEATSATGTSPTNQAARSINNRLVSEWGNLYANSYYAESDFRYQYGYAYWVYLVEKGIGVLMGSHNGYIETVYNPAGKRLLCIAK